MKKVLNSLILISVFVMVFSSCQEDEEKSPLYGYWTRVITDSLNVTFSASIEFTEDNEFFWKPIGENTGHTESSAKFEFVDGGNIKLIGDSDCGEDDNLYEFTIIDKEMTLAVIKDDCTLRAPMVSGVWTKTDK